MASHPDAEITTLVHTGRPDNYIDKPKLKLIARMHGRGWYARTSDLFLMLRISLAEWKERERATAEPGTDGSRGKP